MKKMYYFVETCRNFDDLKVLFLLGLRDIMPVA